MKKTLMIGALILFSGLVSGFSGGSGTAQDPYQVDTCSQLSDIRNDRDASYILSSNVNCSGYGAFAPIQNFEGELDGNGRIVSGLYIDRPSGTQVGLFADLVNDGSIHHIGIEDADVTGNKFVGALIGELRDGTVYQSYVNSSIVVGAPGDEVGAFIGLLRGPEPLVRNAYAVNSEARAASDVGGLIGQMGDGKVLNSYSRSEANITSGQNTDGVYLGKLSGGQTTNTYWGKTISPYRSSAGTGANTVEMKQEATYSGWDFQDVWKICPSANNGFPFLRETEGFKCSPPKVSQPVPNDINVNPSKSELSVYVTDPNTAELNVTFFNASDGSKIQKVENVNSGTVASADWNVPEESQFEWYVNVTDGSTEVKSNVWNFTTVTVDFSWRDNSQNEKGFKLQTNASGSFETEKTVAPNTESTGLWPKSLDLGDNVCFQVQAYNEEATSPPAKDCLQL